MAILVPPLRAFFDQLNTAIPGRSRKEDGWIGNEEHRQRPSGHNPDESGRAEQSDSDKLDEVRAVDLGQGGTGNVELEALVQHLLRLCRAGKAPWIRYLIYNHRIWHKRTGYKEERTTGDPHTGHLHVSSDEPFDDFRGADYRLGELTGGGGNTSTGMTTQGRTEPMLGLKYGDTGEEVQALQQLLMQIDPGCLPKFKDDSQYGDETAKAVSKNGWGDDGRYINAPLYVSLMGRLGATFASKATK